MKIFKNNVCVNLDLNEFLGILESQLFDELLLLIMELDDAGSELDVSKQLADFPLSKNAGPIEREEYIVEDMEKLVELFADLLSDSSGDIEINVYEFEDEDLNQEMFSSALDGIGYVFYDTSGDYDLSQEDRKVRRILNRYRNLVE